MRHEMRLTLTAMVALLLSTASTSAQDQSGQNRSDGIRTPETIGAGRSQGGPAGDLLAKPADPNRVPQQGQVMEGTNNADDLSATNADPIPSLVDDEALTPPPPASVTQSTTQRQEDLMPPGANQPTTEDAEPLGLDPVESVTAERGGSALAANQIYPQDMQGMRVDLSDAPQFGEVAGVVLNLETGRVESLMISAGGFMGTGLADTIYGVPWDRVASIDKRGGIVTLAIEQAQLRTQPEAAGEGADDQGAR